MGVHPAVVRYKAAVLMAMRSNYRVFYRWRPALHSSLVVTEGRGLSSLRSFFVGRTYKVYIYSQSGWYGWMLFDVSFDII